MVINKKKTEANTIKKTSLFLLFIVASFVVILDQISKYIVSNKIVLYDCVNIIPNFLNITHIHNPGCAFGFMAQSFTSGVRNFFFVGISCLIIVFVICFYRNILQNYRLSAFSVSLIVGGAIGNTIDRLRFGKVTDFIDFYIYSYHWPAFNLADSSISIGITIIILNSLFNKIPN